MMHIQTRCIELAGTNYEIGHKLGRAAADILQTPGLSNPAKNMMNFEGLRSLFDAQDALLAVELFDCWCPGINEEIQGFADALGIAPMQVVYYAMTCLKPGCSQMVLMPGLTKNGHVMLARNYEFSHLFEDFTLARTVVCGKYAHLGTSVLQFGRDEGLNECGLAVCMSSCGFPVGAHENMRNPALRGLQFWAVIRTLLENCRDVCEALAFLEDLPIAYNINLLLADRKGYAALVETVDGNRTAKQIDSTGQQQYLHATNHVHLHALRQYEPMAMGHSIQRYDRIRQYLDNAKGVTAEEIKGLLLGKYPEGLCCHYYDDFFGTTKSMIMDLNDGKIEMCWGGLAGNGWKSFIVAQSLHDGIHQIEITTERAVPGFYNLVEL